MKLTKIFLVIFFSFVLSGVALAKEHIAYSHLTDGYWQVWVMAPDGQDKQQITRSPSDKRDPVWIKDGKALAFRTNNGQLYTVGLDGKNEEEFLTRLKTINNPNYCNKTDEVVFSHFDPRSPDASNLWLSDWEGTKSRVLTRDTILKYQPSFSWPCDKIVFVKANPETRSHHVWIMDADGGNPRQLIKDKGLFIQPAFSPDGKTVTFTSNYKDDNYEIYTLDIESQKITRLTTDTGLDTYSRFSPDGTKVVFVSNRGGNQQIWVMDKNGSNVTQLTSGADESVSPAWGEVKE